MPYISRKKHRALTNKISELETTVTSLKAIIAKSDTPANVSLAIDMVAMRSKGMTYDQIAEVLNEKGLTGPKGGRWHGSTVRPQVLKANGSDPLGRSINRHKRNRKVGA